MNDCDWSTEKRVLIGDRNVPILPSIRILMRSSSYDQATKPPYRHKVVRDLEWVISSPQMLASSLNRETETRKSNDARSQEIVPDEWAHRIVTQAQSWLDEIDTNPAHLVDWINVRRKKKLALGMYYSYLMEYWLAQCPVLACEDLVVAKQLLVARTNQTAGQLKFVFRTLKGYSNRSDSQQDHRSLYHWECSVKFFIFVGGPTRRSLDQYVGAHLGENLAWRVIEARRKIALVRHFEPWLEEHVMSSSHESIQSSWLLKGYLFYPFDQWAGCSKDDNDCRRSLPQERSVLLQKEEDLILSCTHARGWWTTTPALDLQHFTSSCVYSTVFVILDKLHWLSSIQIQIPSERSSTSTRAGECQVDGVPELGIDALPILSLDQVLVAIQEHFDSNHAGNKKTNNPILMAVLTPRVNNDDDAIIEGYEEHSRGFVLPSTWDPTPLLQGIPGRYKRTLGNAVREYQYFQEQDEFENQQDHSSLFRVEGHRRSDCSPEDSFSGRAFELRERMNTRPCPFLCYLAQHLLDDSDRENQKSFRVALKQVMHSKDRPFSFNSPLEILLLCVQYLVEDFENEQQRMFKQHIKVMHMLLIHYPQPLDMKEETPDELEGVSFQSRMQDLMHQAFSCVTQTLGKPEAPQRLSVLRLLLSIWTRFPAFVRHDEFKKSNIQYHLEHLMIQLFSNKDDNANTNLATPERVQVIQVIIDWSRKCDIKIKTLDEMVVYRILSHLKTTSELVMGKHLVEVCIEDPEGVYADFWQRENTNHHSMYRIESASNRGIQKQLSAITCHWTPPAVPVSTDVYQVLVINDRDSFDQAFRRFRIFADTSSFRHDIIGIDAEWRPAHLYDHHDDMMPHVQVRQVSIFQMAFQDSLASSTYVFLFDFHYEVVVDQFPTFYQLLEAHPRLICAGFGLDGDLRRLYRDFGPALGPGLTSERMLELRAVAQHGFGKPWRKSLAELSNVCLELELSKDEQCSDWGMRPLSPYQIKYAAMDALCVLCLTHYFLSKVFTTNTPATTPRLCTRDVIEALTQLELSPDIVSKNESIADRREIIVKTLGLRISSSKNKNRSSCPQYIAAIVPLDKKLDMAAIAALFDCHRKHVQLVSLQVRQVDQCVLEPN